MTRTTKRNFPGVYEVHENGGYIGMIMGSEQYTGDGAALLDSESRREAGQSSDDP